MNKVEKYYVNKVWKHFYTEEAFKSWLESLPPETVVGVPQSYDNCPIAQYCKILKIPVLEVTWGHLDIDYGGNRSFAVLGVDREGREQDNVLQTEESAWYVDFIENVDRSNLKVVKASDCLNLLDREYCLNLLYQSNL